MSNIGDGFKNIFLAGIGAMAYTGEKGKEIIDQLVAKGELTLEQGRELNEELKHKAAETSRGIRNSALEATMYTMSPEERAEFIEAATRIAAEQNAKAEQVEAEIIAEEAEDANGTEKADAPVEDDAAPKAEEADEA